MDAYEIVEWVRAVTRWVHVFAAIMWIGQTYLFNWLEANFTRDAGAKPNVSGSLWMVHGGGFYLVEKQKYPELMPKTLHWFKWESATTWLSGAVLIGITYYHGGLLVEPGQSMGVAAGAGIGSMVVGWALYDLLVRSPLGKSEKALAAVGFVLIVALAYGLRQVQSSRAAYIHVGAVIGTIMAANVWMRILPSQRRMLALAKEGKRPDPDLAARAPLRSKHNSYLVVPLVFLMISNHYPNSYGSDYSYLIVGGLVLAGWAAAYVLRGEAQKKANEAAARAAEAREAEEAKRAAS